VRAILTLSRRPQSNSQSAFTLIELLVVIAMIGVLVALLLPAAQAARESARRAQCKNNLKQLALAFLHHEAEHKHLPTGGWGYKWIGDPDSGYGSDQPGGWAYNILPYIEEQSLRDLGRGIANRFTAPLNADRQAALLKLVGVPIPLFNCPSKRPLSTWPYANDPVNPWMAQNLFTCTAASGCRVVRSDYRVNSGSRGAGDQTGPGLAQDPAIYSWVFANPRSQNGICSQRSMVRLSQISDGTAHTAMIAEKYLQPERYFDGTDACDDQCAYTGHDRDNAGYTANGEEILRPLPDEPSKLTRPYRFGGPHVVGFHMAFCDGSVDTIGFDVDDVVWKAYGGRDDAAVR
jgi:prepilin-type N-terminal cleavage/methylation domain-containing protein